MFRLDGQVAIVTGASRGIGRAIAETLASAGAKIAVVATKQEVVDQVAAEIAAGHGVEAKGYALDVSNFDQVQEVFGQVAKDFGSIDIVVNNAGVTRDNLLMRMKEDDWDTVIDVNLKSVFNSCKAVVRQMMKQGYGRIINLSSINGIVCQPGQANYAASKAGVIGITKSVAKEVAKKGVTVNAIAPGFITSDMTAELNEEFKQKIIAQIPVGDMGTGKDIADAVLFLASKEARYITGQVLSVDGGMNA
jgi:3-oxoacyl-[acyl-carrier protein] reductase